MRLFLISEYVGVDPNTVCISAGIVRGRAKVRGEPWTHNICGPSSPSCCSVRFTASIRNGMAVRGCAGHAGEVSRCDLARHDSAYARTRTGDCGSGLRSRWPAGVVVPTASLKLPVALTLAATGD